MQCLNAVIIYNDQRQCKSMVCPSRGNVESSNSEKKLGLSRSSRVGEAHPS
jgi:hypothetical protein